MPYGDEKRVDSFLHLITVLSLGFGGLSLLWIVNPLIVAAVFMIFLAWCVA
jgi:hypothetical protein